METNDTDRLPLSPSGEAPRPIRVMIVAGEASGDKHGAALARSLTKASGEAGLELFGAGGDEMRAAGVDTLVDARDVAIIGILEIAGALGRFYRAYKKLVRAARARRPDVVVLIDWPDFNLKLARRLHRDGLKIVYYISPQVWAWRRYRVRAIRRWVDRMLVILPFEEEFYRQQDVRVEYVGHPLAGSVGLTRSREEFAGQYGLDPARPIIAFLPGSRRREIHYHVPAMARAALRLQNMPLTGRVPGAGRLQYAGAAALNAGEISKRECGAPQFVLPLASTIGLDQVRPLLGAAVDGITVIERDTYNALGHADLAVVASGTATVEAALLGVPMVIIYRASELNWRLIRPLIHLDTFGMVNLIAGRMVVPELIQHEVTGEKIASEVAGILCDPDRVRRMRQDLAEVCEKLRVGSIAGSEHAARSVMEIAREKV